MRVVQDIRIQRDIVALNTFSYHDSLPVTLTRAISFSEGENKKGK